MSSPACLIANASFLHAIRKRAEQEWCHVIITEIINHSTNNINNINNKKNIIILQINTMRSKSTQALLNVVENYTAGDVMEFTKDRRAASGVVVEEQIS